MGRLKKFFFGSSSSKRHRSNSDSESRAGHQTPSSSSPAATGAASPSDTPSQAPHRKGRLRRSLSMKRLRRSFRGKAETTTYVPPASKPHQWQQDEKLVRGGTCNFSVKYLGSIEVTESRGMQICEDAANQLRRGTKKKLRAVLWVSSDGLRVVEEESKGLIVDQTIEKVSFCAPDRNNDKGFSYICRDGTTRRWLCHCFHSLKEPGERLSHAVGCAFAACLERKQQRDKLCGVQVEFDVNKTSFTRQGSFRVQTMTEAMEAADISVMDEKENKADNAAMGVPGVSAVLTPNAIPRRHASSDMLLRQGSVRLGKIGEVTPFKRQLSLRLSDLPSTLQRQQQVLQTHEEVSPPTSPRDPPPGTTNGHSMTNGTNGAMDQSGGISTACSQLSEGLFELSKQGEATPPPIPQRPRPAVHQQHLQPVSNRGQTVKAPGILKPEPGPIKQKNPWEGSPMTAPPQAGAQQPAPPPRPKPTPGLTGVVPPPGSSTNPWAGLQPPALQPDTYVMPQPDTYIMPQSSQYASPGMVNGQQLATAQVHGGGMPHLQNGIGVHPQASANFNNANANMAAMPYGSPAAAGGIGGTWTADLSRTLPQNVNVSPNMSAQQGYDPSWAGTGHQATPPQQVNPFNNAVKTFEINL